MSDNVNVEGGSEQFDDAELGNPPKHPVCKLGPSIYFGEMKDELGLRRSVQVIGWAVLLNSAIRGDERLEVARDRLVKLGFEKTTLWRAVRDLRRVSARCDKVYEAIHHKPMTDSAFVSEITSPDGIAILQ